MQIEERLLAKILSLLLSLQGFTGGIALGLSVEWAALGAATTYLCLQPISRKVIRGFCPRLATA